MAYFVVTSVVFALLIFQLYVLCSVQNKDRCGSDAGHRRQSIERRIAEGNETTPGAYPWQVGLRAFGSTFCSGVLIDKEWVLTAARCFDQNYVASSWIVVLGDYDTDIREGTETHIHVKNIVIHGDFTKAPPYSNDLAIVQMNQAVDFLPICLPEDTADLLGKECVVTGWGISRIVYQLSSKLRQVAVNVVSNAQCSISSGGSRHGDGFLCASSTGGPCTGDMGGSLQCKLGSLWTAAGIVFDTDGCDANSTENMLYTNVQSYLPWILKNIKLIGK